MSFNKETVQTKFVEFKKIHGLTKSMQEYVDHLHRTGYNDNAIESHIIPMIRNMINIANGTGDICNICNEPIIDGLRCLAECLRK